MTNHTEVINYLIGLKGLNRYLELGARNGINFSNIKCSFKQSVDSDPTATATHKVTTDKFFLDNLKVWDLIFIDADHTKESVQKDFVNSMMYLSDRGYIVIHDTNPSKEEWTYVPRNSKQWCGSVFKFICNLDAEFRTMPFDYGITVVKKSEYFIWDYDKSYREFDENREAFLKLVDVEAFKKWL